MGPEVPHPSTPHPCSPGIHLASSPQDAAMNRSVSLSLGCPSHPSWGQAARTDSWQEEASLPPQRALVLTVPLQVRGSHTCWQSQVSVETGRRARLHARCLNPLAPGSPRWCYLRKSSPQPLPHQPAQRQQVGGGSDGRMSVWEEASCLYLLWSSFVFKQTKGNKLESYLSS